jgi:hypothetical protein
MERLRHVAREGYFTLLARLFARQKKHDEKINDSGCPHKKRLVTTRRIRAMSCPYFLIMTKNKGWRA